MNYGDIPAEFCNRKNAKVIIIPVPYDKTSTWIKGADKGPAAIIDASANMELYDIETDSEPYTVGIFTEDPVDTKKGPEVLAELVKQKVAEHLGEDKFVVLLGGEHSVTPGAVFAYKEKYPKLSVLQLDAHSDLRSEYHGSKFNHACVMARVKEKCPIYQVGIRSMDKSEKINMDTKKVLFAEQIFKMKSQGKDWISQAMAGLTDDVYLTIDLDVFDPAIMPSTGTPEPGGLMWYDVMTLIQELTKKKNLVGFDVVELCPNKNSPSSDFLASKLIYKMLAYKFFGEKQKKLK